ncbi:protein-disulfide reductase DsbD family protein [Steroidobacter cummioxidans]|uniref:protein-disulfide reductase DsbD family protein n=1 Tax=Steroidobacter cummioxidans TaxID=1803913 RepID=UPI000E30B877|nr:thioredoxin family protein [Steroidobacter cummioxidans]
MKRLLLLLILITAWQAASADTEVVRTDHLRSRVVAKTAAAVPGQPLQVGLWLDHDPHWHTYWKNPGDSGLPTKLTVSLTGVSTERIDWPVPDRFDLGEIVNYGYGGIALLPVTVSIPESARGQTSITLDAKASWLICEYECIPGEASYSLTLPVASTAAVDERWSSAFEWAAARQPEMVSSRASYRIEGSDVIVRFEGAGWPSDLGAWQLYPAVQQLMANSVTGRWQRANQGWEFRQQLSDYFDEAPAEAELLLTNQGRGLQLIAQLEDSAAAVTTSGESTQSVSSWQSLLPALLMAFAGGLVLNLMPCVFPVLFIKALGIAQAGGDRALLLRHGAIYAAGVVVSFLAIAGLLLGLRAGGSALGWGFQLQQPWFVAAMTVLFFLMALSFAGVLELGGRLAGVGQHLTEGHSDRSAFFTGVLACVVASPCTAPFMGSAIGFALSQPTWWALPVFASLGLGMAAPMLVLTAVPALTRYLPKPGAWMQRLRELLAFPLLLTVAWLLWVFGEQTSTVGMAGLLAALIALGFVLWLFHQARGLVKTSAVLVTRVAAVVVLVGAAYGLVSIVAQSEAEAQSRIATAEAGVEAWSGERLRELRESGQPVFVNMTAAWCITCLANEKVALSSATVKQAMQRAGIVYLKGDWTRQDPDISRYLESFGRNGVPLYVFYPAAGGEPVVLPQLLTAQVVTDALTAP